MICVETLHNMCRLSFVSIEHFHSYLLNYILFPVLVQEIHKRKQHLYFYPMVHFATNLGNKWQIFKKRNPIDTAVLAAA